MKRILYIGGFELPDKNAAAQRVMANAKLLRTMGYDVSFIGVSKDYKDDTNVYDGFSYESIKYPSCIKEWLKYIISFVSLEKISSYRPDYVILYNFPAIACLRILRYCHRHNIKVIHDVTEWEQTEGYSLRDVIKWADIQLRMKYVLYKMDGIIAISRYLYNLYSPQVQTILIPPTVDLTDEKWNINRVLDAGEKVRIIYAGSANSKSKDRLDYIVNAISLFNNVELIVVGLTEQQYVNVFGALPQNCTNISFLGRVSHQEAVKAVCESDFQMLIRNNTRKNRAGFPTKFVESMSCCTPVIATLSSNLEDYLIDGKNGYIVDRTNTLDIILEKVSRLSREERIQMKHFCKYNNGFDYHNYRFEFLKLFPN